MTEETIPSSAAALQKIEGYELKTAAWKWLHEFDTRTWPQNSIAILDYVKNAVNLHGVERAALAVKEGDLGRVREAIETAIKRFELLHAKRDRKDICPLVGADALKTALALLSERGK